MYFNPRPPCGGRHTSPAVKSAAATFQSTSSVWRTTSWRAMCRPLAGFQSTSSVWRTTCLPARRSHPGGISIHVLRVEDDLPKGGQTMKFSISIHVLRVEDDGERCPALAEGCKDFNPRPPCGGRLSFRKYEIQGGEFQSTSSVWRTTEEIWLESEKCFISIHVLRVEDDSSVTVQRMQSRNFNPRPPCGGRPKAAGRTGATG